MSVDRKVRIGLTVKYSNPLWASVVILMPNPLTSELGMCMACVSLWTVVVERYVIEKNK